MAALAVAANAADPIPLALFPATRVWQVTLDHALQAPPGFDGRLGYFPLDDGHLTAVTLATGAEVWTVELSPSSAPAAGDGLVFAATAERLAALHTADGSEAWSIPFSGVGVPLVWKAGWLLAGSEQGVVVAVRASDGHMMWRQELGAAPHARTTIAGDRAYVPLDDGRLVALAIEDGALVWEHRLGGPVSEALAIGDRVYAGSLDNYFYCLDAADGRERWRWRTGADVIGAPVVDERHVYFVSLDNVLRGLDRGHGAQRWKRALPLRPTTGPILAGTTLVVSGLSPAVRGFAPGDGAPVGEFAAPGDLAAPPHVVTAANLPLPLLVLVSSNAAGGSVVTAVTRDVEPKIVPVAPLPGLVTLAPPETAPPPRGF